MTTTHVLETAEADLTYDVRGPVPVADGRPPLFMIGQPMDASGFRALASHLPDRTVITYDPRGLGRSVRKDGRVDHTPEVQATDVHAIITALDAGPVEMFASSGGAVTALALVAAYPDDVSTLVAHEPPLIPPLPDSDVARRAQLGYLEAYQARGHGAGMAAFIAMTSWQGQFTDDYFAQPAPDPAAFGMPTDDDGSRDDPLLSDRSAGVTSYRPARARATESTNSAANSMSTGARTGSGASSSRRHPATDASADSRSRRSPSTSSATQAAYAASGSSTPGSSAISAGLLARASARSRCATASMIAAPRSVGRRGASRARSTRSRAVRSVGFVSFIPTSSGQLR